MRPIVTVVAVLALPVLLAIPAMADPRTATLRTAVEGYAAAACLTRQEHSFLRDQGHLWAAGILERAGGSLDHWRALGDAVGAEAARRPMPVARGDGPVHDSAKPMPLLFCHELVRSAVIRAAVERAIRRLAMDRRRR